MRIAVIILGILGVLMMAWGGLGLFAATFPAEDGSSVASFGWWGLVEIGFGVFLCVLAFLLRRKRRLSETL